ncbi:hypothetical protein NQ176_g9588 [Zarea fungicola]|uniref:Uncharacterized protein n=1 Tax=Zarea fungicola TaxID=93591 RepID=A0ACC1MLS5_9HYPO|nr:hypothetical protein NQ176_g9588 [Lecanicillium fungicola]
MPEGSSQPTSAATTAAPVAEARMSHFGENRGIKFNINTGGKTWACTLQDRSHYEKVKAARNGSTDSSASSVSEKSSH